MMIPLLFLSLFGRVVQAQDLPAPLAPEVPAYYRSPTGLNVRAAPGLDGAVVGLLAQDEPFAVYARVAGEGCAGEGWAQVAAGGFACLQNATPTSDLPVALPRLVTFDGTEAATIPYTYGKRTKAYPGRVWKSVDAFVAGEAPVDALAAHHSYSFVSAVDTDKGRVYVRYNGSAVPASELYVFPVTDFHGLDLAEQPNRNAGAVGWVVDAEGASVYLSPSRTGMQIAQIPYHHDLVVRPTALGGGGWLEVPDAQGTSAPGYVRETQIRRWISAPRPAEVGPDELWIDVNLAQQTLALMHGDAPLFLTLISSGVSRHDTPEGSFRITDKAASGDMKSLTGATESYHVEDVPWVMHFKPRYALHGAFWHDSFGHKVSHGCINLSPRDARYLFDRIVPVLPPGFASVQATEAAPGTLVRIRGY